MSGMLAKAKLVVFMADGAKHEVALKPRHIKAIQQHFVGQDPVDMEQAIYTCWLVLTESGEWFGTLEEFEMALDDIDQLEAADPKA